MVDKELEEAFLDEEQLKVKEHEEIKKEEEYEYEDNAFVRFGAWLDELVKPYR